MKTDIVMNETYFVLPTGRGKGGVAKQDVKIVEKLLKEITNALVYKCYTKMELTDVISVRGGHTFYDSVWGIGYKIDEDLSEHHKFVIEDLTSAKLSPGAYNNPYKKQYKHKPYWKPVN